MSKVNLPFTESADFLNSHDGEAMKKKLSSRISIFSEES